MSRTVRIVGWRLLAAIPTLLLVAVFVFALIRAAPGDPAQVMLGDAADPAALAALHHAMGLDRPLPFQFLIWLGHAATGDLGRSISTGEPVLPLLLQRFGVTALLVVTAVTLATALSVVLGVLAAWRRGGVLDFAVVGASTLSLAAPSFWTGLVLLLVFGVQLHWLPVVGYVSPREHFAEALLYLVLPVATLVAAESGVLTRLMRANTLEVLTQDYVTHARAKGLSEGQVLRRHVTSNAFAPTLVMVGLTLGHLLGGAAVVETVFTLPGLGRLVVESILARDYPVVQGCLLFAAAVFVVVNLLVDLCQPLLDPRVLVRA